MADDSDKWSALFGKDAPRSTVPELVVNHPSKPLYSPFETRDKLHGFEVRCPSAKGNYTFFYHHILTLTINDPDCDFCSIITTNSVIRIYGRNLQPLVTALGLHTCKSFTEFHAERFASPTDSTAPFIERIEVMLPAGLSERPHGEATTQQVAFTEQQGGMQ